MSRSLPTTGSRTRLRWLLATLVVASAGASSAFAQTPGCQVTYTAPTWTGGNGFGASIDIRNTGPAINGWNLVFSFPNGQRVQNGWPVTFSQPAGSPTVTVSSNAPWNAVINTNGTFNVAFNGTHTGTNNPPTSFTLNGVTCGGTPPTNPPPTVSVTAPTAGQAFPAGTTSVNLAANATDNGAVVRVEFRVDGNLVNTDTTAPYAFTATGLAAGNHSVTATAVDNGTPAASTTSTAVAFSIGTTSNPPPVVNLTAPTSGQAFPAGTTTVNLAATATDTGGAVTRVEFRVDGTLRCTDTSSPYTCAATGLAAGSHTAQATAFDNGTPVLSTSTANVPFSIGGTSNPPPLVSITSPTAGQSFAAGAAVPIAATASDPPSGAIIRVEFRIDNVLVSSDTTAPYTFNATGLTTGSHTITATAFDNGNPTLSTVSTPVNITLGAAGAVFRVNPAGRITKNGTVFPVRCGSWFGLEGRHEPSDDPVNPSGAAMEQYIGNTSWVNGGQGSGRTIAQTMSEIAGMGINVIRLPLVPQTLNANDPQGTGNVLKNHSSVRIANSRLALETMIRAADAANIEVMLDIHSCSNYVGWRKGRLDARPPWVDADRDNYDFKRENYSCAASGNPATVTTTHPYNQTMWLDNLRTVAGLGTALGVDNIIGIDIYNEPHDYTWAEWKALTEAAYTAINAVNPNTLLFVQGIGTNAGTQDGTPATVTPQPHGSADTNPNWGENLFEAGTNPINVPKERLVYSPHTYGPSVFVQKMFMDPAQTQCAGLEGDAAGDANCNIVINPTLLRAGWEEHFGYLKQQNYAIVVGEFGGNMDWPLGQASIRDRDRWSHVTPGIDTQWQNAFVDWMISKGIEGCYWSINPESGDTAGWYGHAYDPISNESGWGEWRTFDQRKTNLLNRLWGR
ncbi:MAG TPA: Ig-like domain-containing protein [Steroidobacteraceae bacterium]|nr:Ig-like domain-containing protein [Steroidobacteraceae bacterium]